METQHPTRRRSRRLAPVLVAAVVGLTIILAWVEVDALRDGPVLVLPAEAREAVAVATTSAQAANPDDQRTTRTSIVPPRTATQEIISLLAVNDHHIDGGFHQAKVRERDTIHDWGEIPADTDYEYTFVIHNDGDAPLKILRARPT